MLKTLLVFAIAVTAGVILSSSLAQASSLHERRKRLGKKWWDKARERVDRGQLADYHLATRGEIESLRLLAEFGPEGARRILNFTLLLSAKDRAAGPFRERELVNEFVKTLTLKLDTDMELLDENERDSPKVLQDIAELYTIISTPTNT